jgi:orotate phosphoribosyltransferase
MEKHQKEFIKYLIEQKALIFGDFTTKSGRKTPYFVNTGKLSSGSAIRDLGQFYAEHILNSICKDPAIIFGPAYKGVPLAVGTSIALANKNIQCDYCFDRKEAKEHGDGGSFVGTMPKPGDKVVLVEDVVTAGTTLRKMVPIIKDELKANLVGVCIAVDRCEKGAEGSESASAEATRLLGIKIFPIVTIHQILEYLKSEDAKASGFVVSDDILNRADQYLEQYGA